MIHPLPTPREGETTCEMLERLPLDDRMRLEFRQMFRQLGAIMEAEALSGQPMRLAGQFWEIVETALITHTMRYCRQIEAETARRERRYWESDVERLSDMLSAERRVVLELQKRLEAVDA